MNRLIVTDSTSDIPEYILEKSNIMVLPVNVILNGRTYKDRTEIKIQEFYKNFETYKTMKTSAVSYEEYSLIYLQIIQKYDEILIIHASKELSETYKNAVQAHERFKNKHKCRIAIIDSKQCGMGLGLVVTEAAKDMQEGLDFDQIVKNSRLLSSQIITYMAIPTIKYLRHSKRISGVKALFASAFGVKPVLGMEDGKLILKTKLFGKQKNILLLMLDSLTKDIGKSEVTIALAHARSTEYVDDLKSTFSSVFNCRQIYISYFGPSIGINTGPDTMGITFFKH